ncbi:MAG: MXAN_6640 family putative metalloprotease [Myxococcota bacterium]
MRRALCFLLFFAACGDLAAVRPPHALASRADELRPTDTTSPLMYRYLPTDVVESYAVDGGDFRVHFTRAGVNSVPLADVNDSGVPDFVEQVSGVYESVGATYHQTLGFRRPLSDATVTPNGGDARFDVYLLDFNLTADGAFRIDACPTGQTCIGYVVQENDFAGYGYPSLTEATRILGSHEYFHGIQAAYDNGQDVVVSEGTAVWGTETYDPSSGDFEAFIDGYLDRPDRSLDSPPPGPVPSFAYGSAIFFKFLSEKYDDAIIRKLWERLENGQGDPSEPADRADPTWIIQLDALLKRDYQSSFAQAFREFATWNLYLGTAADPQRSYANGSAYPQPAITDVPVPTYRPALRVYYASTQYFRVASNGRAAMTAALVDDPSTPDSELEGMALAVVSRRGGRNVGFAAPLDVQTPTATEVVDTSGGAELIVAVINTAREGNGAVLSKRPSLCAGTLDEVNVCRLSYNPTLDAGVPMPDAGVEDAGLTTDGGVDAGMSETDGGVEPTPMPQGCGCGATAGAPWVLGLIVLALRGRRRR